MSWNAGNKINSGSKSTFWIGEISASKKKIYKKTYILLIGSDKNIVGNTDTTDRYVSTSYIDAFFNSIEDDFKEITLQRYYKRNAETDEMILSAISKSNDFSDEQKSEIINDRFNKYDINKYIEYLMDKYTGNYCEYEFCAQILSSFLSIDKDGELSRYIIAAPLYVSREDIITERVLYLPDIKKCVLTKKEFLQHKKHHFKNLHAVLLSYGLINEERMFTNEMKTLFESYGSHSTFKSKNKTADFINDAIVIVKKYFYIVED